MRGTQIVTDMGSFSGGRGCCRIMASISNTFENSNFAHSPENSILMFFLFVS